MGKFDFKSNDTCHGDCGKREDSRLHPFLRLGTGSRFFMKGVTVAASAPPESIRLWTFRSGRPCFFKINLNHQRKALGIWDGGTAATWGGKTGKCPAFEFCCAFLICFSPWHSEAPHWLFSNDTV